MEKYYKLSAPIYGKSDHVYICCKYDKQKGGYISFIEALEKVVFEDGTFWGKEFCREYYQSGGDGIELIIPAARRSSEREAEANEIIFRDPAAYVKRFLEAKGKSELTFEEVRNMSELIEKQKQAAKNTGELMDHLIKLIESDDERFVFELADGGEHAMMTIRDKEKKIEYVVNIKPIQEEEP